VPNQAHIAAPTVTLAAAESLPRRDSRRIDMAVVATRDANDDKNLVAPRVHTDIHSGRVHRSKTFVHEVPRPGEYWIHKCLSLRVISAPSGRQASRPRRTSRASNQSCWPRWRAAREGAVETDWSICTPGPIEIQPHRWRVQAAKKWRKTPEARLYRQSACNLYGRAQPATSCRRRSTRSASARFRRITRAALRRVTQPRLAHGSHTTRECPSQCRLD
jgi:hypothetical protein